MQELTDFRKKAADCYAAFKETYDPAEAAAADAYNEAADEIDRLVVHLKKCQTRVRELEAEAADLEETWKR